MSIIGRVYNMPLDYVEQTYFPAAKVRLDIRFEEFGRDKLFAAVRGKKLVVTLKGTKDPRSKLEVVEDTSDPYSTKLRIEYPGAKVGASGRDGPYRSRHVVGGIIPISASWGANGIRVADTLKVQLAFKDLPFDPRCIRACAVEFYLGTIGPRQFKDAVHGQSDSTASLPGRPMMALPDGYIDENGNERSNLRFLGFVDNWETNFPENGIPCVNLECRDFTQLLLDQAAPVKLVIGADEQIDRAIAIYLSNFPQMQGMEVEYRPATANGDIPRLKDAFGKSVYPPKLGPGIAGFGGTAGGTGESMAVWDYITDVCGAIGHVCRVEGRTVVIQRVVTLTSKDYKPRVDDPYVTKTTAGGIRLDRRYFIFGRNVGGLKVVRNFSKKAPTNVEVRCYDPTRKKVLVARYPVGTDNRIIGHALPGEEGNEVKFLVIRVSGAKDEKVLRGMAQSIYETIGRNEITVNISTKNLAAFGGGNLDPDVLDMKAGDAFILDVNRTERNDSTVTKLASLLLHNNGVAELLKKVGYDQEFVQAYSEAYDDVGFQTAFRLREMNVTWGVEDGVSIDIVGINYIEARADKSLSLPPGEHPKTLDQRRNPT
jgi:hypothetical protein